MKKIFKCLVSLLVGTLSSTAVFAQTHDWSFVTTGDGSTYAIEKNGSLWAWGWNESGQLGTGQEEIKVSVPQDISNGHKWTFATSGQAYSFFIREDGTLWTAGDNSKGVSGVGDGSSSHKVLTQVGTDSDWASVAVTRFFGHSAFGIKTDGTLWAWGEGENGSLGLGSYKNVSKPTQVGTDTDWKQVSVGNYFTVAIKNDGTLWGWGWNQAGQLFGNDTHVKTPMQLGTDNDWREVFAVAEAVYGIKNDGSLYVWGTGLNDILGINNIEITSIDVPTKVSVISGYVHQISGSQSTRVVMVSPDGTKDGKRVLMSWGTNADGALGNGTGVSVENTDQIEYIGVPVEVEFEKDMDFVQIACGEGYTVVLNGDGKLYGWGKNRAGQLGDYATEDQMTFTTKPIEVAVKNSGEQETTFTFTADNIPSSLKSAKKIVLEGEWGTEDFTSLTATLGNNSGFPPVGNAVLEEVDMSNATIAENTSLYVPFGTGSCGVFQGCRALKTVKMPAAVEAAKITSMKGAFQNCSALSEIDLTGCVNVTSFTDTFFGCSSLKSADLSNCNNLTGTESLFDKCEAIVEVKLPANVNLEKYMFGSCTSLRLIDWGKYGETTAPEMPRDFFQYVEDLKAITLKVPEGAYESFMADADWSKLTIEKVGSTGINQTMTDNGGKSAYMIYTLDGQYIGNGQDYNSLKAGVYVVKVIGNGKTMTKKIVKR